MWFYCLLLRCFYIYEHQKRQKGFSSFFQLAYESQPTLNSFSQNNRANFQIQLKKKQAWTAWLFHNQIILYLYVPLTVLSQTMLNSESGLGCEICCLTFVLWRARTMYQRLVLLYFRNKNPSFYCVSTLKKKKKDKKVMSLSVLISTNWRYHANQMRDEIKRVISSYHRNQITCNFLWRFWNE